MEGPSLVILKEELKPFVGKKVLEVEGNTKEDVQRLKGQKLVKVESWGKHFLAVFDDCVIKIHYLMFGSYTVNREKPDRVPRLSLTFKNGQWYNYTCSVKILEDTDLDQLYDWSVDVMQDSWDPAKAKKKLKAKSEAMVCDALLEQDIFSGVGNIIKNEVLYRIRVHPESMIGGLPPKKLSELVAEARQYSFDFYKWKKDFVLRKHWLAHKKQKCATCGEKLTLRHTGLKKRRSFFCENCQVKY